MQKIVCFGEVLIDFLARPATSPDAPRTFAQYAGGAPANVAVAVAKLGGNAEFVGMLGSDMFGDFLRESLQQAGVGTSYLASTDAAKTALAFVQLDADGERSFSFYRPPAADLLFRAEHFQPRCFAEATTFHVCSNSLTEAEIAYTTLQGMVRARDAGVLTSFDMNLRTALWAPDADPHPRLWDVLRQADVVKLARTELEYLAEPLGGDQAVFDAAWDGHTQLLLVTDGNAPVRWYTRDASGELPAFRVQAIDTTAAGDAFVGGLLFHLAERGVDAASLPTFLRDADALGEALRFAAATGALTVTRHGAFAAMPSRTEVEQLIRDQHEFAT